MSLLSRPYLFALPVALLGFACSAGDDLPGSPGDEPASGGTGGTSPRPPGFVLGGADGNGEGGASEPVEIIRSLPEGFTPADPESPETTKGGYRVVGPLADVEAPAGDCANVLRVIVRDFQSSHADFDGPSDWSSYEVQSPIGASRKPEKTSENGPLHLGEWYENVDGTNLPFAVDLWLEPVGATFVFDSSAFFPLRDVGFADNYSFTTELHTRFEYRGGEVFTFRGDDDVFVFMNGHLAVNLSGVHDAQSGSVDLDARAGEFEMVVGEVYTFDLFQAERHPGGSNFRLETTLDFTGCGEILPGDVIR